MRIRNLDKVTREGRVRIRCDVVWEDCSKEPAEVFFETEEPYGESLSLTAHPFLVGCFVPAMHFRERRIALEDPVCPQLAEGLADAMALLAHWGGDAYRPLEIHAPRLGETLFPGRDRSAALLMSGGIDSFAALLTNRQYYPEGHPGYVRECLFIHGFEIGGVVRRGMKYPVYQRARQALAPVMEAAGTRLVPLYTNVRHLCDDRALWLGKFCGAVLAAGGHAFASRWDTLYIGSSYPVAHLVPCGTHPLLEPKYSSRDLPIFHKDLHLSRMDKIRLVADWEVALHNLRVCLANVEDRLNCGECEKCLRTMTGLAAVGALERSRAFVADDVDLEKLSAFDINIRHRDVFYRELLGPLRQAGRHDIAEVIETMLARESRAP
ncbi:MAG: hypothetical protein P1P84_01030 [Deferrisomatales bacterium]|nr:hypothetical protein [Deferrisomatales bacterium]